MFFMSVSLLSWRSTLSLVARLAVLKSSFAAAGTRNEIIQVSAIHLNWKCLN
jgi:hypothetical protein